MAATTLSADAAIRALQDRIDITDVLYRYASTIDRFDLDGLRRVLADDAVGAVRERRSGQSVATRSRAGSARRSPTSSGSTTCSASTTSRSTATARRALVYHTSHQVFEDDPDTAKLLVGRYHNELRREHDGWRISRLVLEILWGEEKADAAGYLALIGGRGPAGLTRRCAPPSRSISGSSRCATGSWARPTGAGSSRTGCRSPRTPSTGAGGRPAAWRCSPSAARWSRRSPRGGAGSRPRRGAPRRCRGWPRAPRRSAPRAPSRRASSCTSAARRPAPSSGSTRWRRRRCARRASRRGRGR